MDGETTVWKQSRSCLATSLTTGAGETSKDNDGIVEALLLSIPDRYTLDTFDTSEEYQSDMKMVSTDGNIIISVLPIFCSEGSIGIELDAEAHFHDKLMNLADTFQTITPAAPIRRKILLDIALLIRPKNTAMLQESSIMKNYMTFLSRRAN